MQEFSVTDGNSELYGKTVYYGYLDGVKTVPILICDVDENANYADAVIPKKGTIGDPDGFGGDYAAVEDYSHLQQSINSILGTDEFTVYVADNKGSGEYGSGEEIAILRPLFD